MVDQPPPAVLILALNCRSNDPPLSVITSEHNNPRWLSELLASLRGQCFDYRDVLQQLLRQTMPLLQILGAVVREPDLPLSIFRDQNLERKVDSAAGRRQHQWSAGFRAAED